MDERIYDTNFTEEISNKMQVPKSIRVNGDVSDFRPSSFYADDNSRYGDNFDMRVPEKIILMGKYAPTIVMRFRFIRCCIRVFFFFF